MRELPLALSDLFEERESGSLSQLSVNEPSVGTGVYSSMTPRWRIALSIAGGAVLIAVAIAGLVLPRAGAVALLHPLRRVDGLRTPAACEDTWFEGAGVWLAGWRCATSRPRRGTLMYLHGAADNRGSARRLVGCVVAMLQARAWSQEITHWR